MLRRCSTFRKRPLFQSMLARPRRQQQNFSRWSGNVEVIDAPFVFHFVESRPLRIGHYVRAARKRRAQHHERFGGVVSQILDLQIPASAHHHGFLQPSACPFHYVLRAADAKSSTGWNLFPPLHHPSCRRLPALFVRRLQVVGVALNLKAVIGLLSLNSLLVDARLSWHIPIAWGLIVCENQKGKEIQSHTPGPPAQAPSLASDCLLP